VRLIWLLVAKDLRLLFRDPLGVLVTFGLPFAFALLFGFLFSDADGPRGALRVAIVDEEKSSASEGYVAALSATPELDARVTSLAFAREMLRRGETGVFVRLSKGADVGEVEVVHGPGRRIEASVLQGALLRAVGASAEHPQPDSEGGALLGVRGLPFRLTTRAAEVSARKQGPFDASLPLGMVWGIVCCASIFGVSLVVERQRRTLERLRTAPLSSLHLLASKAIACTIAIVAVELALLSAGVLWLDVNPSSPWLFVLAAVCTGLGFGGLMLALAVISPTERAATGIGWGVLTLLAMIGGGTVPLSAMPPWLESLSRMSPFSWAVTAVEGAVWRGFSTSEMLVPCASLLLLGAAFFVVGALSFRDA
jgi:ABC-2 type transport system permease protein